MVEICYSCNTKVYFNERVRALDKTWHKTCFRCCKCNKQLSLGSQLENKGEPYCQVCYQKNHGARGFRGGSFGAMVYGNFDGTTPVRSPSQDWSSNRSLRESINLSKSQKQKQAILKEVYLPPPAPEELEEEAERKEKKEAVKLKLLRDESFFEEAFELQPTVSMNVVEKPQLVEIPVVVPEVVIQKKESMKVVADLTPTVQETVIEQVEVTSSGVTATDLPAINFEEISAGAPEAVKGEEAETESEPDETGLPTSESAETGLPTSESAETGLPTSESAETGPEAKSEISSPEAKLADGTEVGIWDKLEKNETFSYVKNTLRGWFAPLTALSAGKYAADESAVKTL